MANAQHRYKSNRCYLHIPTRKLITAATLTSCAAKSTADGAAVLSHSIRLSSYPLHPTSQYAFKMIVFAHPDTSQCLEPFYKLGYEVHIKEVPIDAKQIKGDFLREHVVKSGCCGDKEFLKLYSYTLVDYPIVVQLDLDSLIVQPLDDLFDAMLDRNKKGLNVPVQYGKEMPQRVEAFFTRDYNMVHVGHKHPGVQGGFIVLRPNIDYFEEYKRVILEGNFKANSGWGGEGYGGYFGAQQIQGLCSYFFDRLHPGTAVELNRCIYNSMKDSPYDVEDGKKLCVDGKETCEDCRKTNFSDIKSIHFTICQKPWICPLGVIKNGNLCREFHKKWFEIRKNWEDTMNLAEHTESEKASPADFHNDVFQGFCRGQGPRNYVSIQLS